MDNNIFNYGTQGLALNNWNQNMMIPPNYLDPNDPLSVNAGRNRLQQENPTINLNTIPQTTNNGNVTSVPEAHNQNSFGTPNWNWINFSNAIQSGISYVGNTFGDSRQNAVLDYDKKQFNPLNYLPRTSNTSLQDRYGMKYFDDGGEYEEDDAWDLFYKDKDNLQAPSDNKEIIKSKKQVLAEKDAKEQALSEIDEVNSQNFYNSLSFINNNNSDINTNNNQNSSFFQGIFSNEGASTGQPTNLNSSALGRGQMIKSTRKAMYEKLGINDFDEAEKKFKSDPNFEMTVLNEYRDELDSKIPKDITGQQRELMLAKGWYTGNVNYPDNVIPHPEAGNKMTAGEYAKRALLKKPDGGEITDKYNRWFKYNTREGLNNISPADSSLDYDYQSYYSDMLKGLTPYIDPSTNAHYPDTYKLPNHSTFSVESKYYTNPQDQPNVLSWNGDFTPQVNNNPFEEEMKKGGIHIKPENKGKFTEYKKRTGKTTEEALHSKDPHVRQMANFARNAKKWKHQDGGIIYNQNEEYDLSPEEVARLKSQGYDIEIL